MARAEFICSDCGKELTDQDKFCSQCGAKVEVVASPPLVQPSVMTVICEVCGHKSMHGGAYCEACGSKLQPSSFSNKEKHRNGGKIQPKKTRFENTVSAN
jgi:predicted amidophosphoribosyltransferase